MTSTLTSLVVLNVIIVSDLSMMKISCLIGVHWILSTTLSK